MDALFAFRLETGKRGNALFFGELEQHPGFADTMVIRQRDDLDVVLMTGVDQRATISLFRAPWIGLLKVHKISVWIDL